MATYKVTLETPHGVHHIECSDDQYILDAVEEAGIKLPYSCRAGSCGACMGKLTQGTVDSTDGNF